MVKDLSRETEKDGTRKLMLAGSGVAAVLFVGFIVWFAVPQMFGATDYLGRPSTGAGCLNDQQREQLRSILSSAHDPAMDRPNFEMMIGTSVPRQYADRVPPHRRIVERTAYAESKRT
jgi:hypothetical protein